MFSNPRFSIAGVLGTAALVIGAGTVHAQTVTSWTATQEGPAITVLLGSAATSYPTNTRGSFQLATRFDTPVSDDHLIRLEAGAAAWQFGAHEPGGFVSNRVAITRATAGLVRRNIFDRRGVRTPFYAGGGLGVYHFRRSGSDAFARPWRFGIHGLAGIEVAIPESRIAITGEVQLHLMGAPPLPVSYVQSLGMVNGVFGIKIRM